MKKLALIGFLMLVGCGEDPVPVDSGTDIVATDTYTTVDSNTGDTMVRVDARDASVLPETTVMNDARVEIATQVDSSSDIVVRDTTASDASVTDSTRVDVQTDTYRIQ